MDVEYAKKSNIWGKKSNFFFFFFCPMDSLAFNPYSKVMRIKWDSVIPILLMMNLRNREAN